MVQVAPYPAYEQRVIKIDERSSNQKKTYISFIVPANFPTFRLLQLHLNFLICVQKVYKLNSSYHFGVDYRAAL